MSEEMITVRLTQAQAGRLLDLMVVANKTANSETQQLYREVATKIADGALELVQTILSGYNIKCPKTP